jgi:hypothetical protein
MMEQNQNWERPASETSIHSNNSDRHKSCDYSQNLKSLTKDSKEQQDENKQNGQVFDISSEHRPDMISPPADLSVKSSINNGNISSHRYVL